MTPLSRGAGECRDSAAARRTERPPRGVPGPRRTPRCGVGRCSRLGPVLRDGSFPPTPFLLASPQGPVSVSSVPLPSRSFRASPSPLFPSGTGRFPQALPFRVGSPASSSPCPSSLTPPLTFRTESFLVAFSQDRGHPFPLQLPSALGSFPPPPIPSGPVPSPPFRGQGGPFTSVPPSLCPPAALSDTRGPALLSRSSLWLSRVPRPGCRG